MIKEEYKKKYVELILTGEIPVNPYFMYEYKVPVDLDVPMHILGFTKEDEIIVDFDLYLNKKNELVFACNQTPAILCYKPKLPDCSCNKEILTKLKL